MPDKHNRSWIYGSFRPTRFTPQPQKLRGIFLENRLRQQQLELQHVSKHAGDAVLVETEDSKRQQVRSGVFTQQSHPFSQLAQYLFNFVLSHKLFIRSTCIFPALAGVSGDEKRNINILGRLVINGFYEFAQTFLVRHKLSRSRLRPRSGH